MGLNKRTHARQESCMYEQQKFLNIGRYEVVQSVKSYTQFKRQTTYKNKNKNFKGYSIFDNLTDTLLLFSKLRNRPTKL